MEWWDAHQRTEDDRKSDGDEFDAIDSFVEIFTDLDTDGSGLLDRSEFNGVLDMLQARDWVAVADPQSGRESFRNRRTGESRSSRPSREEGVKAWLEATFDVSAAAPEPEAEHAGPGTAAANSKTNGADKTVDSEVV